MDNIYKYVWLLETLMEAEEGGLPFEDISEKWRKNKDFSGGNSLSRTSFNRWRDRISDIFHTDIECIKRKTYWYYNIENPESLEESSLGNWMIKTTSLSSLISQSPSIKDKILVDYIPAGQKYIKEILQAIKECRLLNIQYDTFSDDPDGFRYIKPLGVKLFGNRWYLIGAEEWSEQIEVFALDRIDFIDHEFEGGFFTYPKDFSLSDLFSRYYGVSIDLDSDVKKVVLRAYDRQRFYMSSSPLHHSQHIINKTEEYTDFEFKLVPTVDFVDAILSAGPSLEVLEPSDLREQVKARINDMLRRYK